MHTNFTSKSKKEHPLYTPVSQTFTFSSNDTNEHPSKNKSQQDMEVHATTSRHVTEIQITNQRNLKKSNDIKMKNNSKTETIHINRNQNSNCSN